MIDPNDTYSIRFRKRDFVILVERDTSFIDSILWASTQEQQTEGVMENVALVSDSFTSHFRGILPEKRTFTRDWLSILSSKENREKYKFKDEPDTDTEGDDVSQVVLDDDVVLLQWSLLQKTKQPEWKRSKSSSFRRTRKDKAKKKSTKAWLTLQVSTVSLDTFGFPFPGTTFPCKTRSASLRRKYSDFRET